jgi:cell division protein FtsA
MRAKKSQFVTILDIGTSKICGLTAKISDSSLEQEKKILIIACDSLPAMGINSGEIQDLDKVENIIVTLIQKLEHQSNQRIDRVWINALTGNPKTEYKDIDMDVLGHVTQDHIIDLQNQVVDAMREQQKYIMHAIPIGYMIDNDYVKEPIGMRANKLKVQMALITGKLSQLRNLGITIERAHVEIAGRITTPIASALGCLDNTEKQNGAICIDIGADTTSICVYNKNVPVYIDVLKMGGSYITKDISRAFSISMENAEIVKRNYGSCIQSIDDEKITLELPVIGADYDITGFENRPKSHLTQIIQPRFEEMLELIRDHLKKLGILHPSYRLVITGGGSLLKGIEQVASEIFGMRPRIACALSSVTLPQNISSPEYVALIGGLSYALGGLTELPQHRLFSKLRTYKGFTGKILNWLVQNF